MNVLLAVLCAVAAAGAVAAVLSVRVDDGIVGKLGLILMALGLASLSAHAAGDDLEAAWRPALLISLGGLLAAWAPAVRARVQLLRGRHRLRE